MDPLSNVSRKGLQRFAGTWRATQCKPYIVAQLDWAKGGVEGGVEALAIKIGFDFFTRYDPQGVIDRCIGVSTACSFYCI